MIEIQTDGKGQPYIQWMQADHPQGYRPAWIQRARTRSFSSQPILAASC